MHASEKLKALRAVMASEGIDALIVVSGDPHQNEYLPDYYKTRAWITGFTGSAGTAVITADHAGVWTDSRYFLQAKMQFEGTEVELHKLIVQGAAEYINWLADQLSAGSQVAIDGNMVSVALGNYIKEQLSASGLTIKLTGDLFEKIWSDRPAIKRELVFEHDIIYAGESRASKINRLRGVLHQNKADFLLVSALDEVAWLLNLRGRDIECNPVFNAYILLSSDQVWLFIHEEQVDQEIRQLLAQDGVSIRSYEAIKSFVQEISSEKTIQISPASLSMSLYNEIGTDNVIQTDSPVMKFKAVKNDTEQGHLRQVMAKDGAALVRFFRWLEQDLNAGNQPTEYELSRKLIEFRSQQPGYYGESFDAIVGYKSNGAIIHYKPEADTSSRISPEGILLVDSGGQYVDGTTDITRTIALNLPSKEIKKHFTLVLKGHIAIARAIFPKGTRGIQLDILARQYLWNDLLNYGHGTGHGVGFFLNVHEPPQGITNGLGERGVTPIPVGSYTSNEPGYYVEGSHGIRIENLILCHEVQADPAFLYFETVTLYPIDKTLIDVSLLTEEEINWVDQYHVRVAESLAPLLTESEQAWLKEKCKKLERWS